MINTKRAAQDRREAYKKEFWSDQIAWTGESTKGWFRAVRTLPLLLLLLSDKRVSGNLDPTRVYIELLARHMDSGIVEMVSEAEHSFAAGYSGSRGVRTWQERMKVLEETGFIKTQQIGNLRYKLVLLVHPSIAVQALRDAGKVSDDWWNNYRARQIESKEPSYEALVPAEVAPNVVPMRKAKAQGKPVSKAPAIPSAKK